MASPNFIAEHSLTITGGNDSQTVAMSTTSAQSTALNSESIVVYVSADCFARAGTNPTALSTGVDVFLVGGNQYRCPWKPGDKLALIVASGTGTAYITPGI
jgi:hypothetical protein